MTKVTCAIIEYKGKILIARRAPDHRLAGKWEFPGGKVKYGETPEECLKRELEEEFGIKVEVGEYISSNRKSFSHISIELMAFQTRYLAGSFILADHDEVKWIKPEELLNYDLTEADVKIARDVMNRRYSSGC
jgi:8-oxo-dGTP diphosphatase